MDINNDFNDLLERLHNLGINISGSDPKNDLIQKFIDEGAHDLNETIFDTLRDIIIERKHEIIRNWEDDKAYKERFIEFCDRAVSDIEKGIPKRIIEERFLDYNLMLSSALMYEAEGNPTYAIKSFLLSQKLKVHAEPSVLKWINESLFKWVEHEGGVSMDKAMGLAKVGKAGKAFRQYARDELIQSLMFEMATLKYSFSLNNIDSSGILSEWMTLINFPKKYNLTLLSASTIQDMYERKWAKLMRAQELRGFIQITDCEKKKQFLKKFSDCDLSFYPELKKYL